MSEQGQRKRILKQLLANGVSIPCPESVEIGSDIIPDRISGKGVIIHTGCKIYGSETLIMPNVELGFESPVTLHNCQLGRNVKLMGGVFYDSCFFEGASLASGAQIREACLLEEGARGSHTVGLKHTILLPFVTLGSLINFCDCLMAGGTDEKNHSEVGSSYIHFNYTPHQDKATPSLIGDIPKGVMINQPPIFLGGQGGLAGPVRIGYGTVVAAGTIVRKDIMGKDTILLGHTALSKTMPFHKGLYTNIKRIITLNTEYISNLIALRRWYLDVRSRFFDNGPMEKALIAGAVDKLHKCIDERLKKFGEVANRMPQSIELYKKITSGRTHDKIILKKQEFFERWPDMQNVFKDCLDLKGSPPEKEAFLSIIDEIISRKGKNYLMAIKSLNNAQAQIGTTWLQRLVDEISNRAWNKLPSFRTKSQ